MSDPELNDRKMSISLSDVIVAGEALALFGKVMEADRGWKGRKVWVATLCAFLAACDYAQLDPEPAIQEAKRAWAIISHPQPAQIH